LVILCTNVNIYNEIWSIKYPKYYIFNQFGQFYALNTTN
jgi:hypothetical protein